MTNKTGFYGGYVIVENNGFFTKNKDKNANQKMRRLIGIEC